MISFNTSGAVTVKYDAKKTPQVRFTLEAATDIALIVEECETEVAFVGNVKEDEIGYLIDKIYLLDQEVSAASADLSEEGWDKLANEILDKGGDTYSLRFHGHSHVNMPVNPSPTDEEELKKLAQGYPAYLRGIFNKKGEALISAFFPGFDIQFSNLPFQIEQPELQQKREIIKKELTDKLRKKTTIIEPFKNNGWKKEYWGGWGGWGEHDDPYDGYTAENMCGKDTHNKHHDKTKPKINKKKVNNALHQFLHK